MDAQTILQPLPSVNVEVTLLITGFRCFRFLARKTQIFDAQEQLRYKHLWFRAVGLEFLPNGMLLQNE